MPVLALACVAGCGVEPIEETSSSRSLPAEVGDALDASCNRGAGIGCHADAAGGVAFDRAGAFMSLPDMVVPTDAEASRLGQVILDGSMPIGGFAADRAADRYVILGWIAAGAPLEDAATDGGSSSSTGGSETGNEADSSADTGTVEYDAFVPVLEILAGSCGGASCHRDGGTLAPVLDDDVAYDNLVGVASVFASDMAPYVDPGNAAGSHLMRRIAGTDGYGVMPAPPAEPISAADQQTIADWIDGGAEP